MRFLDSQQIKRQIRRFTYTENTVGIQHIATNVLIGQGTSSSFSVGFARVLPSPHLLTRSKYYQKKAKGSGMTAKAVIQELVVVKQQPEFGKTLDALKKKHFTSTRTKFREGAGSWLRGGWRRRLITLPYLQ